MGENIYIFVMCCALVGMLGSAVKEAARVSTDSSCRKYGFDAATFPPDTWFSVVHCERFSTGEIVSVADAKLAYERQR